MDNKKKKNKKKKGNSQNKAQDDVPAIVEQQNVMLEQDSESASETNNIPKVSSEADLDILGVSNVELDKHKVYEDRFAKLQEEITLLKDEKNQWVQKEVKMEEKIKLLQGDVDSCTKKEACLEEILKNLQGGNNSIIEKEAISEDRFKLIESIKDSWILKETLIDELSSRMDEVNLRLQEQVKELKASTDGLVQENAELKESIAVMVSRLEHMEAEAALTRSSHEVIREQSPIEEIRHFQPETAPPLVEEQEQEKSELIEKVKEVHIESDQHARESSRSSHSMLNHENNSTEISVPVDNFTPNYDKEVYESTEIVPSLPSNHNSLVTPDGIENFGSLNVVVDNDDSRISEDVVSVPLDDVQVQEAEPQREIDEHSSLPLSDAPLIGAPFRIISFFAKYVSGADLVDRERERD